MSFAGFFARNKTPEISALLQPKDRIAKESPPEAAVVKPSFCALLGGIQKAAASFDELHPRYPKGHEHGGQFMPKGSQDYNKAVEEHKHHITQLKAKAKSLAEHLKAGGNTDEFQGMALVAGIKGHTKAADIGDDRHTEIVAGHLADAGLTPWQKNKHGLAVSPKDKEFMDKVTAAANKAYNKKMADKKTKEHEEWLQVASESKAQGGENCKAYKEAMSKANKAAAKAMEYGQPPAAVATIDQQVNAQLAQNKEKAKQDLYAAALQSAKNSHMGIMNDEHDQQHVDAFTEAKKHFTPEELISVQNDAIAANQAKVEKGIENLAQAKLLHAQHQHKKSAPKNSPEYQDYKDASAAYKHHYNDGAVEHGLSNADKAIGVQKGYALHNAQQHGAQVIAPPAAPLTNQAKTEALQAETSAHAYALGTLGSKTHPAHSSLAAKTLELQAELAKHIGEDHAKNLVDYNAQQGIGMIASPPLKEIINKYAKIGNSKIDLAESSMVLGTLQDSHPAYKALSNHVSDLKTELKKDLPANQVEDLFINSHQHGASQGVHPDLYNKVINAHTPIQQHQPAQPHLNAQAEAVKQKLIDHATALGNITPSHPAWNSLQQATDKLEAEFAQHTNVGAANAAMIGAYNAAANSGSIIPPDDAQKLIDQHLPKAAPQTHEEHAKAYENAFEHYYNTYATHGLEGDATGEAQKALVDTRKLASAAGVSQEKLNEIKKKVQDKWIDSTGNVKPKLVANPPAHLAHYDTPNKVENAVYSEAHAAALSSHHELPNDFEAWADAHLGNKYYSLSDQAVMDANEGKYKPPQHAPYTTNYDHIKTGQDAKNAIYSIAHVYHAITDSDTKSTMLEQLNHLSHHVENMGVQYSSIHAIMEKAKEDVQEHKYNPPFPTTNASTPPPLPQAAQPNALSHLDTPSKIKNALYDSAHKVASLEKLESADVTKNPEWQQALNHMVAVEDHAKKNGLTQAQVHTMQESGSMDAVNGIHKLPFKAKSKNKGSLPLAAQAKPKVKMSPLPEGTEGDPHGLKQIKTKEQAKNAMYALGHLLLNAKARHGEGSQQFKDIKAKGIALSHHIDTIISHKMNVKMQGKAIMDNPANKYELPHPKAPQFEVKPKVAAPDPWGDAWVSGTFTPTGAAPKYGDHPLSKLHMLGKETDSPEIVDLKKKVYDASHKVTALAHNDINDHAGINAAAHDLSTFAQQLDAKTQHQAVGGVTMSAAVASAATEAYVKDHKPSNHGTSTLPPVTPLPPEPVAPVAAPEAPKTVPMPNVAMPTTKETAEDLNKTLAKNYYILRKLHGGSNDHPEVAAAYKQWNDVKDHMKASLGFDNNYFSDTSGKYKSEVEQSFNAAEAAKIQAKQSAKLGYQHVSEQFHDLALAKGEAHPEVVAAKAGLEAARKAAKEQLSPQEIQDVDSIARQGAAARKQAKKDAAVKEISDAGYKYHYAAAEHGPTSPETVKAYNDLINIGEKNKAAGLVSTDEAQKAYNSLKKNAEDAYAEVKKFKEFIGNPAKAAEDYDKNSALYDYLPQGSPKWNEAKAIGQKLWNEMDHDAKAAVGSYTSSGYSSANKTLAGSTSSGSHVEDNNDTMAKAIDVPLGVPMKLRRNMPQKWFWKALGLPHADGATMGAFTEAQLQSVVGKVYHEPSFSSTSYDGGNGICLSNTASSSGAVVLRIRAGAQAKGIFIDTNSSCSSEREVILQRGAAYVVRGVKKLAGQGKFKYEVEVDLIGHVDKAAMAAAKKGKAK